MLLVYYTSSTGHNKQNFTQNTHANCVSECVHVCILHYLPTEWSWLSALHTVNQRSASGQKNRALPSNTQRHTCVYTHTDTLRSADHKLPKHAVTANRQRGSAANNTGVRERERERYTEGRAAETIVTSHYTQQLLNLTWPGAFMLFTWHNFISC